jgi:hypothetical protein
MFSLESEYVLKFLYIYKETVMEEDLGAIFGFVLALVIGAIILSASFAAIAAVVLLVMGLIGLMQLAPPSNPWVDSNIYTTPDAEFPMFGSRDFRHKYLIKGRNFTGNWICLAYDKESDPWNYVWVQRHTVSIKKSQIDKLPVLSMRLLIKPKENSSTFIATSKNGRKLVAVGRNNEGDYLCLSYFYKSTTWEHAGESHGWALTNEVASVVTLNCPIMDLPILE